MDEQYYEKLLNIKTSGEQKSFNESIHYHRYEPTSYDALEALSKHYGFSPQDSIVDFGCGKGRFAFYVNHFYGSAVTGIEMNSFFYKTALENRKKYIQARKSKSGDIIFSNCFAESYAIHAAHNKFYFFNPFSVQIFARVLKNISTSMEQHERTADIILYYPSSDYICYLDTKTSFVLMDEIKVPCMSDNDLRHSFFIFRTQHGW